MLYSCRSKLVYVVSEVPRGSVLGSLHLGAFLILEKKLIGYADDSTLIAVVTSPGIRVTVEESLCRDLVKVSQWCDLLEMKLNTSKT